ncbi:MAG: ATP-binding protein, partial [Verrucomicrobia bacterium]|nr:ATP-binding protein [Verrucomicrobiota bacterium]
AWYLAQRALRPVTELTRIAERVTAHGLGQRIPSMTRDQEFNRLITVFNEMLNRLEASFQQATRFSADASHELKTPLARLQAELEQALQTPAAELPPQQVYGSLIEEIHRLKSIVQKLLLLSLADAGRLQLKLEPINLSVMLANVVEDSQAQAPSIKIEQDIPANIHVNADAELLEQALQNLASNAIKYNHDGGLIRFALAQESDRVLVSVTNTGQKIPPAQRERIFQRFHRADPARSGRVGGVGLGLSLAREIIRAHKGELSLASGDDDLTTFSIVLPTV